MRRPIRGTNRPSLRQEGGPQEASQEVSGGGKADKEVDKEVEEARGATVATMARVAIVVEGVGVC